MTPCTKRLASSDTIQLTEVDVYLFLAIFAARNVVLASVGRLLSLAASFNSWLGSASCMYTLLGGFLKVPYLSSAFFLWNMRWMSGANSASASTTTPTQA